jgi:hypothetical protein
MNNIATIRLNGIERTSSITEACKKMFPKETAERYAADAALFAVIVDKMFKYHSEDIIDETEEGFVECLIIEALDEYEQEYVRAANVLNAALVLPYI